MPTSITQRWQKPHRTFKRRGVSLFQPTLTLDCHVEPTACCLVMLLCSPLYGREGGIKLGHNRWGHSMPTMNCHWHGAYLFAITFMLTPQVEKANALTLMQLFIVNALTLLVWHWEEHLACKNRKMRCCHSYLSGEGAPSLAVLKCRMICLPDHGLSRLSQKRDH